MYRTTNILESRLERCSLSPIAQVCQDNKMMFLFLIVREDFSGIISRSVIDNDYESIKSSKYIIEGMCERFPFVIRSNNERASLSSVIMFVKFTKGKFSDEKSHVRPVHLDFSKKKQWKIKKKYHSQIDKHECSTIDSENSTDTVDKSRKKYRYDQSSPDTKKHEKMESIKSLLSRYIIRRHEDNHSWYDEEKL